MKASPLNSQRGVILVGAIIVTTFFLTIALAIAGLGLTHYSSTRHTLLASDAQNVADAGADAFMSSLASSSTYQGTNNAPATATNSCSGYTSSPVTLVNNATQGKITYSTCVQNGSIANEKLVFSTSKLYIPATNTTPTVTREVELVVHATTTAGYGLLTGPGGLTLSNSAAIAGSQVYIGGQLTMNNSSSIGTAANPATVYIADLACGTGAAYPSTCAQGAGPAGDAAVLCCGASPMIYGAVHIVNFPVPAPTQSQNYNENRTGNLMTSPGLVDNTVPAISLPADNRTSTLGTCTTGGGGAPQHCSNFPTERLASTADCPYGQTTTTWAAGTHFYGGNINVDQSCQVTVGGPIWIDGNLVLSNSATLAVASGLSAAPSLFIDGSSGFEPSNSSALTTNSSGVGFAVTTFWSAASCSPNCTSVTGSDLSSSVNHTTILMSNSFKGTGSSFYARWSNVNTNNSSSAGSLMGQSITINNAGTITLGSSSAGATGTWAVTHYTEVYP